MIHFKYSLFVAFLLFSISAFSQTQPSLEELATQESWLSLVHYRESGIFSDRWESEADDPDFFLANKGKSDPLSELTATYQKQFIEIDRESICRFPARYAVIANYLKIDSRGSLEHCQALVDWKKELAAKTATLVFPAAYLDSPSSMFGHTLLRLDKSKEEDSSGQLSHTYSFAAQMPESGSELAFVYRGLVGGYPGETATPPYYLKLKEYQDIESRDIWEYRLNLTPDEMNLLLDHMWEIKDVRFDYYFFSENCSYRVMALLNAAKPNQGLLQPNRIYTIPVVTVRDAISADIVEEWRFRPSARTQLDHDFAQLDDAQQYWVQTKIPADLNTMKVALKEDAPNNRVLDVAYQYARMLPAEDQEAKQKSFALLRAKNEASKNQELQADPIPDIPLPIKRDDEGHESERLAVMFGTTEERNFVDFEIRPAYHELLDPAQGYPTGSELIFGKASLRYLEGDGISLNELTVIGIKSFKSVTPLFNPMSWAVNIGADRENVSSSNRLAPTIKGSLGKGTRIFDRGLLFALGGGEARFDSRLRNNSDIVAYVNAGAIYKTSDVRFQFDYLLKDSVVYTGPVKHSFEISAAFELSASTHLVLNSKKTSLDKNDREHSLGVQVFF